MLRHFERSEKSREFKHVQLSISHFTASFKLTFAVNHS